MKLRARRREEPEVNLTSLIDVVLLLLVFFMVTTSFVRESELAIRLPQVDAESPETRETTGLEIAVTAQGDYLVNGRALVDNRPGTLRAALQRLRPAAEDRRALTVSADANASHQAVVTAMDVAGRLGFSEISIATVRQPEQGD